MGFHTFPVRLLRTPEGKEIKKPMGEWRDVPMDTVTMDYQNYGVRLDKRIVVVDVDVKRGKKGGETWLKMRAMLTDEAREMLDQTGKRLICGTISGGRHHFFKLPDGVHISKINKGFQDIDFLSEGSFIVGPGTYFDTGLPYQVLDGFINWDYIPDYPKEWLAATIKREHQQQAPDREFDNTPGAIHQFTQYCINCPIAIENNRGDETTLKVALAARDLGLDEETAFKIMWHSFNPRCQPPWDEGGLETKIHNAYMYGSGAAGSQNFSHLIESMTPEVLEEMEEGLASEGYRWSRNKNGIVTPNNENNTICYLAAPNRGDFQNEVWGLYRFNQFTQTPEYAVSPPWYDPKTALQKSLQYPKDITEAEIGSLKHYLFQKYGYETERSTCAQAMDFVSRAYMYHPIRSWLNAIEWDGVERLDNWLPIYLGTARNEYTTTIGPKVLMGAVSRIFEPGCKMDYTLILEGEQGTGKSTVCEILGVYPDWFATIRPDTDKDTRQVLSRKWIIEFAEIDALNRAADASKIKAFMTSATDTYRPPYAHAPQDFPRQSIFIGTVNPGASYEYLNDITGGRRFWPVETGDINLKALKRDVIQLYAEAVHRYKQGEMRYVAGNLTNILEDEVRKRQFVDPFVEKIRDYWEANPEIDKLNLRWTAMTLLGLDERFFDKRVRARLVDSFSFLGWKVTGSVKEYAIAPVVASKSFDNHLVQLPELVNTLRANLDSHKSYTLTYLCAKWDLGKLNQKDKQKLSRALRDIDGVSFQYDLTTNDNKVVIEPLE